MRGVTGVRVSEGVCGCVCVGEGRDRHSHVCCGGLIERLIERLVGQALHTHY